MTVAELQTSPAAYAGKTLKVDGTLENAGERGFTDRRLVLRQLEDTNWVPGSVARDGDGRCACIPVQEPPADMDYLGKKVAVVGVLRTGRRPGRGCGATLMIESATK